MDIEDYKQAIATNVRREREKKGWTQVQLCMSSAVAQTTLSKIERYGSPFSFKVMYRIADALGVSAHALIPATSADVAAARAADLAEIR